MLLFADGFENFDITDLSRKWDYWISSTNLIKSPNDIAEIIKSTERKGARCLYGAFRYFSLHKYIKKSRTVFLGFALKAPNGLPVSPAYQRFEINFYADSNRVATCIMTFSTNAVNFHWLFGTINESLGISLSGIPDQYVSLDTTKNPKDGFLYYQLGFTLTGNTEDDENCTGWVENKVTSSNADGLLNNIRTAIPESFYWIDEVRIKLSWYNNGYGGFDINCPIYLDDIYICNAESSYNNTFLGDVRIRAMIPELAGSINNASMINFTDQRHLGVACDFVNTVDEIPATWDYDTYPDLIEYANPLDKYLRMSENGTQLFSMTNPNYGGSTPKVFGVVAHTICRAHEDIGKKAKLELVRKHGIEPVESSPYLSQRRPIQYYNDWESYSLAWDNDEELVGTQQSTKWTPEVIGADQWGFKLVEWTDNPTDYLTAFLRLQQNHYEVLYEYISTIDFTHRHWDRVVIESLLLSGSANTYWAQFAYESLGLTELQTIIKRVHHGVGEELYFVDSMPWYYLYLKEILNLNPEMLFAYGGTLNESLPFTDSSYHEWVEELISELFPASSKAVIDVIETIIENLNLTEPLLWDNHETLEENIELIVSYLWSNHEELIEYLSYSEYDFVGWGHVVSDNIEFIEDHFDGWWVEEIDDGMKMWFEGIVQQWRHEWFIGIIIASTRIAPIEDTGQWGGDGMDGDRTGYNSW